MLIYLSIIVFGVHWPVEKREKTLGKVEIIKACVFLFLFSFFILFCFVPAEDHVPYLQGY